MKKIIIKSRAPMSEETKRKISESLKKKNGKKIPIKIKRVKREDVQKKNFPIKMESAENYIERENKKRKPRIHSADTKNKISESMKNHHVNRKEKQKSILNLIEKISNNISKSEKLKNRLDELNKLKKLLDS